MKKYGNTEWQYMAAMARDYASKMQSNNDVDAETGKYLYAIIDEYDRNASSVLKRLYENEGVVAVNICTYQGGYQTICVKYTDETEYNFDTNGQHDSLLDDMICNEINAYITGRIDESKSNTNMKTNNRNVVRLTESQLKQTIAESVRNVLKEGINNGLHEDLSGIIQSLEQLANSKYIPFSSPAPSSTESVVKHNVKKAIELLTFADIAAQQLRY